MDLQVVVLQRKLLNGDFITECLLSNHTLDIESRLNIVLVKLP